MRPFALVWGGQLVSVVGSALTGFVLAVWVYQVTGSVTQLALVTAANTVPGILLAPVAGVVADRWDRKKIMIIADFAAAVPTAVVAVLYWADQLQVWQLYLTTSCTAAAGVFHSSAYFTLVPKLVPKRHLGRINGLFQVNFAMAAAAPVLGGILLSTLDVDGVLLLDLGTFVLAATALLVTRLPEGATKATEGKAGPRSMLGDLGYAFRYLAGRPGLLWLIGFSALFDLLFAFAEVLIRPLILAFGSPATLGLLMFVGGAGLFAGTLVMTAWGGPRRKVHGSLLFTGIGGLALALHSLAPSALLIAIVAPVFLFTLPIVNGCVMTVFQTKVDSDALGRVTGLARVLWQAATPLGALIAGPLADLVFEPAMRAGGTLAGSVGSLLGTGPGRGIALLYAVIGLLLVLLAIAGSRLRRLRLLEDELPDAVTDDEPTEPAPAR
ncbi:MFS transporter [Amycolatopsis aidingensis]|uniref:MFS transporter n=1 Tax=Amycolatopsis aidingensis TaxID=2842453 RepID=UPI001C0BA621|nr:MFS transporter [Amycolatopsis aidingensis]